MEGTTREGDVGIRMRNEFDEQGCGGNSIPAHAKPALAPALPPGSCPMSPLSLFKKLFFDYLLSCAGLTCSTKDSQASLQPSGTLVATTYGI